MFAKYTGRGRQSKSKNKALMKQYCTLCVIVCVFECECDSHFDSIFTCFLRAEWEIRMAEQCALHLNHLFPSTAVQSNTIMYSLYQFALAICLSLCVCVRTCIYKRHLHNRCVVCVCFYVRDRINKERPRQTPDQMINLTLLPSNEN